MLRPHGADVGGEELLPGQAVAALGLRLLQLQLPGRPAADRGAQPDLHLLLPRPGTQGES